MHKRIYFDSCIWIPLFLPDGFNNPEKDIVKDLIKKSVTNKDEILISTLVFLEIIDKIREIIIESHESNEIVTKRQDIIDETNQTINTVINKISKLESKGFVRIIDPIKTIADHYYEIYNISSNNYWNLKKGRLLKEDYPGRIISKRLCGYDGAHHLDINHAINAIELKADELYTFDKGFHQIQKINDFSSLNIIVLTV